jgi:dipeptidase D
MVCEKDKQTSHDFSTDPIRLIRKEDWITADGTTLGADNGIGVAVMLAIMEDAALMHPDLEFLFTVEEETGLTGANNLSRESFTAKTLINLDSEDEGTFCIGCAGGMNTELATGLTFQEGPEKTEEVTIRITGLRGGHSGTDIHEGFGNAIKLLTRFLQAVLPAYGYYLCGIQGGSKHNAIPREAEALIRVSKEGLRGLRKDISAWTAVFRSEFEGVDEGITLSLEKAAHPESRIIIRSDAEKILNILQALPHGPARTDTRLDTVMTSSNLALCFSRNNTFIVTTSQRSLMQSALNEMVSQVRAVGELAGCRVTHGIGYPAWRPNLSSQILKTSTDLYRRMYGSDPKAMVVHAGLECAVIGEKIKGVDMISMGPAIEHPHSPHERVNIRSVERFWDFLLKLLEYLTAGNRY